MIEMKKITLFTALIRLNALSAFGQKTELYGSLNSGLFSFRGSSVREFSVINAPQIGPPLRVNPSGPKTD
jgi:hypothetical protein